MDTNNKNATYKMIQFPVDNDIDIEIEKIVSKLGMKKKVWYRLALMRAIELYKKELNIK